MGRIRQIRREDGVLVPFRERRIADLIDEAFTASGSSDRALAEELASVVALFVEKYHGDGIPTVLEVDDILGRALRETGHGRAAKAFEELREARLRLQQTLIVRTESGNSSEVSLAAYDRDGLVQHLVSEKGLPDVLADEMALAVERRLIRAEFTSISRGLLEELVDHELLSRGLESLQKKDPVAGLPQSEIAALVRRDDLSARTPDRLLAEPGLTRFALTEIHGRAVSRAHDEGRLHVYGTEDPLRVERVVVPASLLFREARQGDDTALFLRLRQHLEALRDHVRAEIVLPDLALRLSELPFTERDPEATVEHLLMALDHRDAYGRAYGPLPHLFIPIRPPRGATEKAQAFLCAMVSRALATEFSDRLLVTLVDSPGEPGVVEDSGLAAILGMAAERTGSTLSFPRSGDSFHRDDRRTRPALLRVSLGRVAVNLVEAVADVDATDFDSVQKGLAPVLSLVFDAFTERFWHQRQGGPQGLHGLVVRLGGPGHVQVLAQDQDVDFEVWGLAQALDLLVLRGILKRPDRPKAAARLLSHMDDELSKEDRGVRFCVRIGGTLDRHVRRRLVSATEQRARRFAQNDVLSLLSEPGAERGSLPVVVPLFAEANRELVTAPFVERIGPGLALPLAAFGETSPQRLLSRVRTETRLGLVTLAKEKPGEGIFEVQEELF